jgi:hypothetical protein
MAFQQFPQKGGIPSGNTAARPSNPVIGDTYYNGEIVALEIYDGTNWKVMRTEGFPPGAPTISSVTDSSSSLAYSSTAGTLDVVFVPAGTGGTVAQYNAFTTSGGHSGFTTVGETVVITGLTPGTAYTVYGNAQNGSGTSVNTANFSPVTPTTKPQAPTIGTTTLSGGLPVVNWTLNNSGGKNLTSITITPYLNGTTAQTSRTAASTSATSYTFTSGQLTEDSSYTFKVKTTTANGDSPDSSASNSVTVNESFTVDYLVIAGGGSGAQGGGGAGGYRTSAGTSGGGASAETALTLSPGTNYTVTVGGGGASTSGTNQGSDGTNSVFSTITSNGGGGGGRFSNSALNGGRAGGSSGGNGGADNGGTIQANGSPTANQGYIGGTAVAQSTIQGRGGGGGAGGAGVDGTTVASGPGGVGVASSITGTSVTRGGGGGAGRNDNPGAAGGSGGGGAGNTNNSSNGSPGDANTGGGGGGHNGGVNSGAGGSGVVIIRYPDTMTITIGAGLTGTESSASGGFKRATITAGTGNVSWN